MEFKPTYKPFLRLVAEDIQTRFGKELQNVAVVFNNNRPITYLKKYLSEVYETAIWSPQFFTIQEFLKLSSNQTEASQLSQFFYLYELHNQLLQEEGSEPETLEEFYPIAEIILSDFGQLDYDLVLIDEVYMELYDSTAIDVQFQHFTKEQQQFLRQFWQSFSQEEHTAVQKRFLRLWKRLPRLYKAFKEKLINEKQTNYPTIYRDLAEAKAENSAFVDKFKKVLFVGFNALNRAESTLFKQWQDSEQALFYFDTDAYYLDDKLQEAGLFIRRNLQQTGLKNALGESVNIIGNRTDQVFLYASTGRVSQTKLLYDILEEHESAEKTSAILLADESLLVPLLQSLPKGVEPNITTGYPIIQSPIYGLIDLWMEVHILLSHQQKDKIPYQLAEEFMNHPLTKLDGKTRLSFQEMLNKKQYLEITIEDIPVSHAVLPHFFRSVKDDQQIIPALINILDSLLESLAIGDRIRQIESNLLVETKKVLNQLYAGLEKIGFPSISFQIGLIKKAIAPINSAIEGDPLKGLQIMGLLESRCLNFDQVYILGANEGILPQTSNHPTFIPHALRRAYGLPVLENQDALSAYLFYRHFQYSGGIHVLYNSVVNESSSGEESRFIKQLEFESNFKLIKKYQQQPISLSPKEETLAIAKEGKIWKELYDKYVVRKEGISATAFTTYLQSPLLFFLKYVVKIEEPPIITQEFEMNRLGTVIHEVMQQIYSPFTGNDSFFPVSVLEDQLALVDQLTIRGIAKEYGSDFTELENLNSLQRIMHRIAVEYVKTFVRYDMDNYEAFRIIDLENHQNEKYTIDVPVEINGESVSIRLYGIIDRIDEVVTLEGETKRRVVDYKTGADSININNFEKAFAAGTDHKALVQTMFYTYVLEQATGEANLEPHLYVARTMREEGTLFYHKKNEMRDVYLSDQKKIFKDFLQQTLHEIFDPTIPFKHHAESKMYEGDPFALFYRTALKSEENEENSYV